MDIDAMLARAQAARERADACEYPGPWEVGDYECTPTESGLALAAASEYEYMKSGAWLHHPVVQTAWIHGQGKTKMLIQGIGHSPYSTPATRPHIYPNNAAFIAAAITDVPALAADVEALVERVRAYDAAWDTLASHSSPCLDAVGGWYYAVRKQDIEAYAALRVTAAPQPAASPATTDAREGGA